MAYATSNAISSNGFSVDQQINDAVDNLTVEQKEAFNAAFPEYATLTWDGGWINTEVSGVEGDYMSWVADWIEANTNIYWEDGEPWLGEGHFPEDNVWLLFDEPDDEEASHEANIVRAEGGRFSAEWSNTAVGLITKREFDTYDAAAKWLTDGGYQDFTFTS